MRQCKSGKTRTPGKVCVGFSLALVRYGWIKLKELYGSHSLTFNSLVEAEIGPDRTAQYPFLRP